MIRILTAFVATTLVLSPCALDAELGTAGEQTFGQDDLGNLVEAGDNMGAALAAGDFDGDGYVDLAIGLPGEGVGAIDDAGSVLVVYGSPDGLDGTGALAPHSIHQDVASVQDVAEAGDGFGFALAVADFNQDGFDELVVGVPFEDVAGVADSGSFHVFPGGPGGLVPAADEYFTCEHFLGAGTAAACEELGAAFATGERISTVAPDLLVGVPGSGAAFFIEVPGADFLDAGSAVVHDPAWNDETSSRLGAALAYGDLDGGVVDDVLAGAPDFTDIDGSHGPSVLGKGATWFDTGNLGETQLYGAEVGEALGSAVAVGDFRRLGYDQLLLGAPGYTAFGQDDGGRVRLYDRVTDSVVINLTQNLFPGESAEPFDHFGEVIAVGDFNADGFDDAAFGVPGENFEGRGVSEALDGGIVHVAYGNPGNLGSVSGLEQTWTWGLFGQVTNDHTHFGAALAVGDFDGDGDDDLAIGAPGALWNGQAGAGAVQIVYSFAAVFVDGFESGSTSAWSSSAP